MRHQHEPARMIAHIPASAQSELLHDRLNSGNRCLLGSPGGSDFVWFAGEKNMRYSKFAVGGDMRETIDRAVAGSHVGFLFGGAFRRRPFKRQHQLRIVRRRTRPRYLSGFFRCRPDLSARRARFFARAIMADYQGERAARSTGDQAGCACRSGANYIGRRCRHRRAGSRLSPRHSLQRRQRSGEHRGIRSNQCLQANGSALLATQGRARCAARPRLGELRSGGRIV